MSQQANDNKMGSMPVGTLIISMAWPAILSMVIQALYNVVDSIFVSMISEQSLAAVTYIFPVQMLLVAVGVGTGVGTNSLIARRLGAKRFEEADRAANHGYRLSFLNWVLFAIIGIFCSHIFIKAFTHTPYIVANSTAFMRIILIGSLFVLIQMSTEKILQATGNMIFPMLCSVAGVAVNIALDPLLIFGIGPFPKLGVPGAAIATVIGQLCSMILGQILLFRKQHQIKVTIRGFKVNKQTLKDIYSVGFPAILMQSLFSIVQFGLNGILTNLSETAIAVSGAYFRMQSFIFMPIIGLNQGSLPVMGYNYGAGNKERVMQAFKRAFWISFTIMMLGFILFQVFPHTLLSMFSASPEMYAIGVPAFRTISICFIPASFGIISTAFFQATGHGVLSLWGSLLRQLIGILLLAWIFARISGLHGVWYAFPLSEILGFTYCVLAFRHVYQSDIQNLEPEH